MNKEQKQEVIETLKDKFSQYSNFYITDTQNLSVAQITNLRRHCFDKKVEMKVAKNTLIKKALESLDNDRYSGVYDSLHQVTALMFSDSPKEPALIISSFRKSLNGEKPLLKAAFLNGDVFVGDNQLINLTKIKTKNELIGEVIGLLMSPIQRVIGALQNRPEATEASNLKSPGAEAAAPNVVAPEAKSGKPGATETKADTTKTEASKPEAKVEAAEPKVVVTEAISETPGATEPKAEITKPASGTSQPEAKVEVAEPKVVGTEAISETPGTTETKAEVTKPASEASQPEAKVETAEPKVGAAEATSGTGGTTETKAEMTKPGTGTSGSETKESEPRPEA